MGDKVFDLLEKLFIEVQEIKKEQKETNSKLNDTNERITKVEMKIENEVIDKINALFDGYNQTYEISKDNNKKLSKLIKKSDMNDLKRDIKDVWSDILTMEIKQSDQEDSIKRMAK